jgi:predicted DNA binding CopG/RHH family protein|tara:strand:- start:2435 stop:2605 length:171 start_codon:yes stop_codon:yes gene_type:complete
MTEEQTKAINRVMEEYAFPEEFNYWKKDHEIIMRLDESTLIAIHTSGVVTEHKQGA